MSVQTQIDRISGAVSAALAALTEKGVTVPDGTKVDGLAALIAAIEAGGGGSGGSGGANIAVGSFTPSSEISDIEVTHNLGTVPNFAVCWFVHVGGGRNTYQRLFMFYHDGQSGVIATGSKSSTLSFCHADAPVDISASQPMTYANIYAANNETIRFGGQASSSYKLKSHNGNGYTWIVGVI